MTKDELIKLGFAPMLDENKQEIGVLTYNTRAENGDLIVNVAARDGESSWEITVIKLPLSRPPSVVSGTVIVTTIEELNEFVRAAQKATSQDSLDKFKS